MHIKMALRKYIPLKKHSFIVLITSRPDEKLEYNYNDFFDISKAVGSRRSDEEENTTVRLNCQK